VVFINSDIPLGLLNIFRLLLGFLFIEGLLKSLFFGEELVILDGLRLEKLVLRSLWFIGEESGTL